REELDSQLQILQRQQAALAEQLAGFKEIKASYDSQLQYHQETLDGLRELADKGYASRNQLLEGERSAAQLTAQQASALAALGRTRQALSEGKLKLLQQTQTFRSDAETQLTQMTTEASNLADQIEALEFQVKNGGIVAPVDGQVIGLAVHTEGGVVP